MPWTRTGRPTAFESNAASIPASPASLRPIGAGARNPDPVPLVLRQAERAGDTVAREMRLLRAGPQRRPVGLRGDDGAGRTHAGVRLDRPFVLRFDNPRGTGKGRIDLARRNRHLAFDDRCLANVVVE